jgi:oleate hydratase
LKKRKTFCDLFNMEKLKQTLTMHDRALSVRDPKSTQAWLIGSGIASLTAAMHLIRDAQASGCNIHILDRHTETEGGIISSGDVESGLIFHPGSLLYEQCVEHLLYVSLIPRAQGSEKCLLDTIGDFELRKARASGNNAKIRLLGC